MTLENIKNQLENSYKELMDYVKELEEFKKATEYTCDSTTLEMIKGNMENQEKNSKSDKQEKHAAYLTDMEMTILIRKTARKYDSTDFDSMGELSLEVKDLLIEQNYIRKNLTRTSENRNTDSALIYALLVNLAEIREEYNEEITDETIDNPVEDFSEGKFGDVIYELFA